MPSQDDLRRQAVLRQARLYGESSQGGGYTKAHNEYLAAHSAYINHMRSAGRDVTKDNELQNNVNRAEGNLRRYAKESSVESTPRRDGSEVSGGQSSQNSAARAARIRSGSGNRDRLSEGVETLRSSSSGRSATPAVRSDSTTKTVPKPRRK